MLFGSSSLKVTLNKHQIKGLVQHQAIPYLYKAPQSLVILLYSFTITANFEQLSAQQLSVFQRGNLSLNSRPFLTALNPADLVLLLLGPAPQSQFKTTQTVHHFNTIPNLTSSVSISPNQLNLFQLISIGTSQRGCPSTLPHAQFRSIKRLRTRNSC